GRAKGRAGALDDASSLVATAESGRLGEVEQARAALLRGQISFLSTRASEATLLLLQAAERLRDIDPELARETYLEAVTAAIFAGPLAAKGASSVEVAPAAEGAPPGPDPPWVGLLVLGVVAAVD